MPVPEIVDVSMESIEVSQSPAKILEPPNPQRQAPIYTSSSEEGALVPTSRRPSRKPSNQLRKRSQRAATAPIGDESDSGDVTEGGRYRGPRSLSNHYTMHVNAPGPASVPTSPYAPHILLGYVRVIFNTSLVLGFLYILVVIIVTVRRDIEDKVSAYTGGM